MSDSFVFCQLTPAGRGAVACVAVEGPGAAAAIAEEVRTLRDRAGGLPLNRPVLGKLGPHGEDVIVVRRGEMEFEIHCHGGFAPVEYCFERLADRGGQPMSYEVWIARHAATPVQAAARAALANARTERCAAILLDQFAGAFDRALRQIRHLISVCPMEALRQCDETRNRSAFGRRLTQPWRVALVGRTNVGKSSLMNALAGFARAIVHAAPGTTRDLVTLETSLDGWPVELYDTAGLREAEDDVERAGVALAETAASSADVVVVVLDGSRPAGADEKQLIRRRRDAICVLNKCDLPAADQPLWVAKAQPISVSAERVLGLDLLAAAIVRRFGPPPRPGDAVPFCLACDEALSRLRLLAIEAAAARNTAPKDEDRPPCRRKALPEEL